jgi:hypothetical protein
MAAELKILLGNAIKRKRSALGISQEELAARAGLHRTYVSDVERGARNPSLESVQIPSMSPVMVSKHWSFCLRRAGMLTAKIIRFPGLFCSI